MIFLVQIEVRLPSQLPDEDRRQLLDSERERGSALVESGLLRGIWRVPGKIANISIYDVDSVETLDAALTSLPLWPWMTVDVVPLARHPLGATVVKIAELGLPLADSTA